MQVGIEPWARKEVLAKIHLVQGLSDSGIWAFWLTFRYHKVSQSEHLRGRGEEGSVLFPMITISGVAQVLLVPEVMCLCDPQLIWWHIGKYSLVTSLPIPRFEKVACRLLFHLLHASSFSNSGGRRKRFDGQTVMSTAINLLPEAAASFGLLGEPALPKINSVW